MTVDPTNRLAEKIARVLENDPNASSIEDLREAVAGINARLDALEMSARPQKDGLKNGSGQMIAHHASMKRFEVKEALAEAPGHSPDEKACAFEPNGKPCDHCHMCSCLGF